MTCGNLALRAARRNSRTSASSIVLPTHRLLFLTKIWTTRQPASRPRSMARGVPPAMDWCAPMRRSFLAAEEDTSQSYRGEHDRAGGASPSPTARRRRELRRICFVVEVGHQLGAEH